MLFDFQFLNHNINRVGEIPCFFIEKSITENEFDISLFPEWFRDVVVGLPGLLGKFKDVFLEIKEVQKDNQAILDKLCSDLVAGYSVSMLCSDVDIVPPNTEDISEALHVKIKLLFNYFFETTLKDSKKLYTALETTFNNHYDTFRTTNLGIQGKVCPMCGLHEYPLSANEPKAQYDHWLPQDIYPLLAINFNNLVPICGICNGIKHNKDLLFDIATRTICFYPYIQNDGFLFSILSYSPVDELSEEEKLIFKYGKYTINIIPNNPSDNSRIDSWNRVFNIKARYSTYLSDYNYEIRQTFKEYLNEKDLVFENGSDKANLLDAIQQFRTHRIKNIRRETGAHLKNAYLDFISANGNEYLLYTFFGIKLLAA